MKALSLKEGATVSYLNEYNRGISSKVFPRQFIALGVCAVSLPAQQAMIFKVPHYWGDSRL